MSNFVNAARGYDYNGYPVVLSRLSPKRYLFASYDRAGNGGSFSNRSGKSRCVHMAEADARKLIREDRSHDYPFHVPASDKRFKSRVAAMAEAVLVANGQ